MTEGSSVPSAEVETAAAGVIAEHEATREDVPRGWRALHALFQGVLTLGLALIILEIALRIIGGGAMPMYPIRAVDHVGLLPANKEMKIGTILGLDRASYNTDGAGARILGSQWRHLTDPGLLVIGDSQVMGWRLAFHNTFGAQLAERHLGDAGRAKLLASPGMDPETARVALHHFELVHGGVPSLVVVSLTLGNDLDEAFVGRQLSYRYAPRAAHGFLAERSRLYNYWTFIHERYLRSLGRPPGVQRLFYTLSTPERSLLAEQIAHRFTELSALLDGSRFLFLLIPDDIQVSPALFERYRPFYDSADEFGHWSSRVPEMVQELNRLEQLIADRLRAGGFEVLQASETLRHHADPKDLFEPDGHHLSSRGHEVIAEELLNHLMESDP